eukprot:327054-Chlamydomonas_euryale.AAC.1
MDESDGVGAAGSTPPLPLLPPPPVFGCAAAARIPSSAHGCAAEAPTWWAPGAPASPAAAALPAGGLRCAAPTTSRASNTEVAGASDTAAQSPSLLSLAARPPDAPSTACSSGAKCGSRASGVAAPPLAARCGGCGSVDGTIAASSAIH